MGSFSASFRIARRLTGRSKARNALVATMILLPVAGMVAAAVVVQSGVPTLDEYLDYTLGGAEAELIILGPPAPREQFPLEPRSSSRGGNPEPGAEIVTDPLPHLPAGTGLVRVERGYATVQTDRARASVDVVAGEVWNPALDGAYHLLDGRAPCTDDEVLASPALLEAFGMAIGDRLEATTPRGDWTVVGTLREADRPASDTTLFVRPGVIPGAGDPVAGGTLWYVLDTPLDWDAVKDLNRQGIGALSRSVAAQFPEAWDEANWRQAGANSMLSFVAIAAGFGAFQVGLLAGAAFAVGARQEQRLLALVATTGADRRVLMRIVSLGGVVIGLVAAALAIPIGVGGGRAFLEVASSGSAADYPGLHIPWPVVGGIALAAVLVGWIAAAVPARAASRIDLMRALRGSRAPTPSARRIPVRGIVMTLLAGGVTVGGGLLVRLSREMSQAAAENAGASYDPLPGVVANLAGTILIVVGGAGVIIGAILCCGAVLRLAAHLLRRTGPTGRIATRDLERNRGRAVPAIAASLSATFVFAIIVSIIHTIDASQVASYRTTLPPDHARLVLTSEVDWGRGDIRWATPAETRRAVAALERSLPVEESRVVAGAIEWFDFGVPGAGDFGEDGVGLPRLEVPGDSICPVAVRGDARYTYYESAPENELRDADPRCADTGYLNVGGPFDPKMQVGSIADLEALLGVSVDAETRAAFADDVPIVLHPHYLGDDGRIRIAWYDATYAEGIGGAMPDPVRIATPSAHLFPGDPDLPWQGLFLSPAAADELVVGFRPMAVYAQLTQLPTDSQLFEAYRAVSLALDAQSANLHIERGPNRIDPVLVWGLLGGAGIITLAAALAALGLARIEGRADDATLSAVGAGRGMRRRIAFVQAVVLLGTGGLLGTATSLIPLSATALGIASFDLDPPWEQLAVLALALPLIGGVLAFAVTRSTPSARRRAAIA